jgi:hypothetical protein
MRCSPFSSSALSPLQSPSSSSFTYLTGHTEPRGQSSACPGDLECASCWDVAGRGHRSRGSVGIGRPDNPGSHTTAARPRHSEFCEFSVLENTLILKEHDWPYIRFRTFESFLTSISSY